MRYELSDYEWAWWPFIVSPIHTLMPPSQKVSQPQLILVGVEGGDGVIEGHSSPHP